MTDQQELYRLQELAAVAPVLINGELWPLTYAASTLAAELRVARQEQRGSVGLIEYLYQEAITRLGAGLFVSTLCTPLCAAESPDLAGATVLVRAALSGHLSPRAAPSRRAGGWARGRA